MIIIKSFINIYFPYLFLDAISISIVGSVGHSQVLFLKSMNIKDNEVGPLCPLGSLGSLGVFGVFGVS